MDKVELKVGDSFQQACKGCTKPMWFKVLSIDRLLNKVRVECHSVEGYSHEEEWDDLNLTEAAFSICEYKMMNRLDTCDKQNYQRRNNND